MISPVSLLLSLKHGYLKIRKCMCGSHLVSIAWCCSKAWGWGQGPWLCRSWRKFEWSEGGYVEYRFCGNARLCVYQPADCYLLEKCLSLKCAHSHCFWNSVAWEETLTTLMNRLPISTPFACDFNLVPSGGEVVSPALESELPLRLWSMKCSRSEAVPVLSRVLERLCKLLIFLLSSASCHMNKFKLACQRMRGRTKTAQLSSLKPSKNSCTSAKPLMADSWAIPTKNQPN